MEGSSKRLAAEGLGLERTAQLPPARPYGARGLPPAVSVESLAYTATVPKQAYDDEYAKSTTFGDRSRGKQIFGNVCLNNAPLRQIIRMSKKDFDTPDAQQKAAFKALFSFVGVYSVIDEGEVVVFRRLAPDEVVKLMQGGQGFVYGLEYTLEGVTYKCVVKVQTSLSKQKFDAIKASITAASGMRDCAIVPGRSFFGEPSGLYIEDGYAVTLMEMLDGGDAFEIVLNDTDEEKRIKDLVLDAGGELKFDSGFQAFNRKRAAQKQAFGDFVYDILLCLGKAGHTYADFKLDNVGYKDPDFLLIDVDSLDYNVWTAGYVPWKEDPPPPDPDPASRLASAKSTRTEFESASMRVFAGGAAREDDFMHDHKGNKFATEVAMRRWYVTVYAALMSAARFLSDRDSLYSIFGACEKAEYRRLVSVPDASFLKTYIERANDTFELSGKCRELVGFCGKLGRYIDAVNDQMAAKAAVAGVAEWEPRSWETEGVPADAAGFGAGGLAGGLPAVP